MGEHEKGVGPIRGISLSDRIKRLIAVRRNPATGREYSLTEITAGVHALAEQLPDKADRVRAKIGRTYIWQLQAGISKNPTIMHLQSLADFFGVPIGYFVDTIDTMEELDRRLEIGAVSPWHAAAQRQEVEDLQRQLAEEKAFNQAMSDHGVRRIAQRLGSMDAAQRRQFLAIADALANLDEDDAGGAPESAS